MFLSPLTFNYRRDTLNVQRQISRLSGAVLTRVGRCDFPCRPTVTDPAGISGSYSPPKSLAPARRMTASRSARDMEAPRLDSRSTPRGASDQVPSGGRLGWSGGCSASSSTTRPAGPLAVYFCTNLVVAPSPQTGTRARPRISRATAQDYSLGWNTRAREPPVRILCPRRRPRVPSVGPGAAPGGGLAETATPLPGAPRRRRPGPGAAAGPTAAAAAGAVVSRGRRGARAAAYADRCCHRRRPSVAATSPSGSPRTTRRSSGRGGR